MRVRVSISQIASNNVPANVDSTFTAGNLVVNGQYGVLTIAADGSYSYARGAGTPGGVNDVSPARIDRSRQRSSAPGSRPCSATINRRPVR